MSDTPADAPSDAPSTLSLSRSPQSNTPLGTTTREPLPPMTPPLPPLLLVVVVEAEAEGNWVLLVDGKGLGFPCEIKLDESRHGVD